MGASSLEFSIGPNSVADFAAGDKVYLDGLRGLVPCVVLATDPKERSVTVRVTGKRPGYKVGDVDVFGPNQIVQRTWVKTRRGQTWIVKPPK